MALTLALVLGASLLSRPGHAEGFSHSQIKAVYIYNFASFIRWNSGSFSEHPDEFHFCAYQDNKEVTGALSEIIEGERINKRQLILRILDNKTDPQNCQILFTGDRDFQTVAPVRQQLLTVSDQLDFALSGGIIELQQQTNRIRPRINLDQLGRAGLSASSQLLRISDRISTNDLESHR